MKTTQTNITDAGHIQVDFEIVDKKGRMIGARIATYEVDFVEAPDATWGYWEHPAGHFFAFEPHATRDSRSYGAGQGSRTFSTEDERSEAIAKYLVAAKKRASKIA